MIRTATLIRDLHPIAYSHAWHTQIRAAYAALDAGSLVICPQIIENQLVWALTITSATARAWTVEDAALIREVVERAWETIERVKAGEALRHSEERFRAIVSQTTAGICRTTSEGTLMFVNRKFCEILGYNELETIGRTIWEFMPPADEEASVQLYKQKMAEGIPFEMEIRLLRNDNSIVWASISVAPIRDRTDNTYSTIIVVFDITERKILEHQKEDFIGIASHELKTPVTSIKAYAEVLQEIFKETGDEKSAGMMQKLDAQVDRLTELLHALLDTTRIGEEKLLLHLEQFDLNQLIHEQVEDLTGTSKKHRIQTHLGALPPIKADREHIGQVLTNLITNALKYSPDGGDVIITSSSVNESVKISVQDFGIGIPQNMKHRIFDRFFRISHPKVKAFPGMGLGLYITAGVVHHHGGTISVDSREGQGSIFTVTLPLSKVPKA